VVVWKGATAGVRADGMKITIATGPLLPVPAVRGGAMPRIWQGLAEEFAERGHEVCIVARAFPGQPHEEVIKGVRYLRSGGFAQSLSITVDLAKDFIYAGINVWRLPSADILVISDVWLPVFAGWFRRSAGRIVVNANRFPKGQFRLYRRVSRIAAASTVVRNAVVCQCPVLESRTRVVPNPVDTHVMYPGSALHTNGEPKTVLFAGRLHPEKGVHVLVEAFGRLAARHPHWRLQLVGPIAQEEGGGGVAYEQRLKEIAQGLPVEFSRPVFDSSILADVYRNADIFCYPSLAETGESFGVAPLEAMACGVAPVVSRLECFDDFITDGETGWVFDHRSADPVSALVEKLDAAMRAPAHVAAVARRAAEVAKQFSYNAVAEQYLADFAALLAADSGGGAS